MQELAGIVLAQAVAPSTSTAPATPSVIAAAATAEPNWWVLLGLIYLGFGLVGFAGAIIGGCYWNGTSAAKRDWAAGHQIYGTSFATLLALVGLTFFGIAQFQTIAMGPLAVSILLALIVICLGYVLVADMFDRPMDDEPAVTGADAATVSHSAAVVTASHAAPGAAAAIAGHGSADGSAPETPHGAAHVGSHVPAHSQTPGTGHPA